MLTRQRIVTYGIPTAALATIALAATLSPWVRPTTTSTRQPMSHPPEPPTIDDGKRQVDVVFAVDTTGSMGGLLDGAKRTVWSIAKHIQKTDSNASVRIGLVAYRDVGDDYVTKDFALTTDLDAVFAELSSFQAAGGGDTPENVDAALDVTLHKMQWRPGAKKLVFLVGDAPPASRGEVPTFDVLAREAGAKNIIINTIRAGHDGETAVAFQQIASLGKGEFSSIQQDGGVQQIATPYDDKLAELSARVDSTMIIAGDEGVRREYKAKMAAVAEAAPAAAADRAAYYAGAGGGKGGSRSKDDLVEGVATGSMSIEELDEGDLPSEYRGMDRGALKAEVEKRAAERQAAQKEIFELAKKRDEFLENEAKNRSGEGGFDVKVKQALEVQLK
ncbi:MAG: VWA domain-containing protein [Kofleriaceae bacterium]|nr:VWA domain-containing protein [Kofleriaceae bacterium]